LRAVPYPHAMIKFVLRDFLDAGRHPVILHPSPVFSLGSGHAFCVQSLRNPGKAKPRCTHFHDSHDDRRLFGNNFLFYCNDFAFAVITFLIQVSNVLVLVSVASTACRVPFQNATLLSSALSPWNSVRRRSPCSHFIFPTTSRSLRATSKAVPASQCQFEIVSGSRRPRVTKPHFLRPSCRHVRRHPSACASTCLTGDRYGLHPGLSLRSAHT
jgi:hypothetical protein